MGSFPEMYNDPYRIIIRISSLTFNVSPLNGVNGYSPTSLKQNSKKTLGVKVYQNVRHKVT